ncbi:MAG: multidrug effflux MFS transporter [Zhengella sp.]|uniref:multidrug effflux MFS transporter n=1 Tax=Zhengella sp. TaxID=2282762 RepID=UPI001D2FBB1F|nr:multidrug effflux MFS transporter [Notoacmeibacter sp.]MCC0026898.1 multidrug effflux MFS transporter [Brucellaceae bacterium]
MSQALGRYVALYCGLLMSIGAFSIDISLPAIPAMVRALDEPYAMVQWTVTIYMFASAFGQLLWGPASDRFGRKAMLGGGLAFYFAGSMICVFAPDIVTLLAGRALQGFGASAAIVMSRAFIRDLYSGEELARNLALATMFFALGPIIAPFIGSGLAALFGWRAIFAALVAWSLLLIAMMTGVPETLKTRQAQALSPASYWRNTLRLLRHPQSRRFIWVSIASMTSMLLIIASAPRIYETSFGLTGLAFASYFAFHGIGIVIGQVGNRHVIRQFGVARAAVAGNLVLVAASGLILAAALSGIMTPVLITGLLILYATSYLVVYSNAAAMVLDPHGEVAGFATALYGFASMIGSSTIVSALVLFNGGSMISWAASLLAICLVCLALTATWRARPA